MRRNVARAAAVVALLVAALSSSGRAAAVPPDIDLGPTSLVFGVMNQGQTSASQDVVVANTGAGVIGPIVIDGAVPPGEAQAEVFLFDDHCTGLVLQPGDHCALTYSFRPFFVRVSAAQLDIQVLEQSGPDPQPVGAVFRVTLEGEGVNPIQVSPTVLDFGSVTVGTTSAPIGLRLHNPSAQPFGPLDLAWSQRPEPPFSADPDACWGAVLPPDGSCEIPITFQPDGAGAVVATATVGISATANRASVEFPYQLQGCGDTPAAPCAAVIPTSTTTAVPETTTTWGVDDTTTTVDGPIDGPIDTVADTTTMPVDGSTPPAVPGSGVGSAGAALPRTGSGSPVPLVATGTLLLAVGAAAVLTARRRRLAA